MSKFVDEIIKSIKNEPELWIPARNSSRLNGVRMGSVAVVGFGNSRPLSVIEVLVDGLHVETTYFDNWKLESAVLDWYRTQDLDQIIAVPLIIKTTRPSTS